MPTLNEAIQNFNAATANLGQVAIGSLGQGGTNGKE